VWVATNKKLERNDINNTFAKAYSFLPHMNIERMDSKYSLPSTLGILKN
jgi:hypothetical protein